MTTGTTIFKNLDWHKRSFILIALYYVVVAVIGLNDYISLSSMNFPLGLLAIISAIKPGRGRNTFIFASLAILFSIACLFIPGRTVLYFALGTGILFLVDTYFGRISFMPFLALILASPLFRYASDVFSFPIRLKITEWSAAMLSLLGNKTEAIGNLIQHNGTEMSVDPECMGLNMMVASTLAGVVMLNLLAKKFTRKISTWSLLLFLVMIIILNVFSNLLRIITLVHLAIQPGTMTHELIGLLSFVVYVLAPGTFIASWMIKKLGIKESPVVSIKQNNKKELKYFWVHLLIAIHLCVAVIAIKRHDEQVYTNVQLPTIKDYVVSRITGDILKIESKTSLTYLKYIPAFYTPDHNPMICWKGSGYSFFKVRLDEIDGAAVYTAELTANNEKLFTAWWYENGNNSTIEQLQWRKDVLKGARKYYLVNVTAADRTQLEQEVRRLHMNRELKQFFLKGK